MRAFAIVLAAMLIGLTTITTRPVAAQSTGVYTVEQATAGAKLYAANCAACHGQSLEGVSGPPLSGSAFIAKWTGQTADDLNYIMSTQMPQTAPGSLKPDEYLDLVAYVLQQNKYTAGSTPLTAATSKSVKIAAQGN